MLAATAGWRPPSPPSRLGVATDVSAAAAAAAAVTCESSATSTEVLQSGQSDDRPSHSSMQDWWNCKRRNVPAESNPHTYSDAETLEKHKKNVRANLMK